MNQIPKIAIIGRPNVGKSSLFNRLIGQRKAIVHGVAGTTRDIITEKLFFEDKAIELLDTAGYLTGKEELTARALEKVKEAIDIADSLIFVVDGTVAPTNIDIVLADLARKSRKEAILVVNKADSPRVEKGIDDYKRFGFKQLYPVSAIHNIGITALSDALKKLATPAEKEPDLNKIKISIIGRPNVGKSSLLNKMIGEEKAIVSDIPGTTRDVVSGEITATIPVTLETNNDEEGQEANEPTKENTQSITFKISDTAGARKPGKIGKAYKKGEPVEKFSSLRAQREIEHSDIVLVVIDADDKVAAQDLHIAGKAKEMGKGIVLVINKWDLVSDTQQDKFLARLRYHFNFMMWVPAIFVSAKTGRNVEQILPIVKTVAENQRRQVNTSKLNRILEDFALGNTPKGLGTYRPKLFFISQTDIIPPTFSISAKHHNFIHFSWRRAFENELRRQFDFTGTPIKVEFLKKN